MQIDIYGGTINLSKRIMGAFINSMLALSIVTECAFAQNIAAQRTTDCVLTITSPQSADSWDEGSTYNVTWQVSGSACGPEVYIDLYKNGTLYWQLVNNTENDGTFLWTVPPEIGMGDDFAIVIGEPYPSDVRAESVLFSINSTYPPTTSWAVFPAAAKTDGANGTHWATDLVLRNPVFFNVFAVLYFCERELDNTNAQGAIVLVPAMQAVKLHDVVANLFGRSETSGFITMRYYWIGPDLGFEFDMTSRTYNDQGEKGTYGQEIPGLNKSKAIRYGWEAHIINLAQTDQFRTNIGFSSIVNFPISVSFKLYKGDGTFLGEGSADLKPFGHTQINEVIRRFTSEALDNAFIEVSSSTDKAYYFAYASVVDNRTGDPSFILAQ